MAPPTSFRELLDRYRRGERDFTEADLDTDRNSDLRDLCLDGADFSHAFIIADFRRASLRGARFFQANVKTCDFRGADLRDADFRGAALCAALFDSAIVDGADFTGAHIYGYSFRPGEKPDGSVGTTRT